jgi:hypothetical protein
MVVDGNKAILIYSILNTSMLYFLVVEAVTAGNSLSEDKEWRLEEDSLGGCTRQSRHILFPPIFS